MFELVTNAVEHAGIDMMVTVTRRDDGLHLMVRDGNVVLPQRLPSIPARPVRGPTNAVKACRVEALTRTWGARPINDGTGKIVWATILSRHTSRRR
jgi:hypothetical protein